MACFADINISQGSVATYVRCGGIFNIHLTKKFTKESSSEIFFKSVKIWQNYGHESVPALFWPMLYKQQQNISRPCLRFAQSGWANEAAACMRSDLPWR